MPTMESIELDHDGIACELDRLSRALDELDTRPVTDHVPTLTSVLDALVEQLDDLARQLKPQS